MLQWLLQDNKGRPPLFSVFRFFHPPPALRAAPTTRGVVLSIHETPPGPGFRKQIPRDKMREVLSKKADASFNCISIDSDTSTSVSVSKPSHSTQLAEGRRDGSRPGVVIVSTGHLLACLLSAGAPTDVFLADVASSHNPPLLRTRDLSSWRYIFMSRVLACTIVARNVLVRNTGTPRWCSLTSVIT